ncbi:hypothetical protein BGAL_0020g00020 [Botrytis galanthina]|uniref:3-beta hydroxysteroid dehydrogenase/isomerase domain-containing protein n=1 Tax=Botrytis galanthina TaxID=278940 RepID=A0A4S8RAK7_9HELO|nr:hypothetical protein BGAL_0020g00020 [Botrytis galanthina]
MSTNVPHLTAARQTIHLLFLKTKSCIILTHSLFIYNMSLPNDLGVVLVTGGCGYLGSHIVKLLSTTTTSEIHVISRNPKTNILPNVTYHKGDITDYQHVTDILTEIKPKVIIHTVSPRHTDSAKILRKTNIEGTQVLLECATKNESVKAFVYTSSDSTLVNTPQEPGVRLTEDVAKLFTENSKEANTYSKTKAVADAAVLAANDPPNLYTATLRIPSPYGKESLSTGVLLNGIKKNQHKMQVGDNKRKFGFIFIESAAMAHILAAKALVREANLDSTSYDGNNDQKSSSGKVNGEAFFISDGVSMPYFNFARKVVAMAGHPVAENEVKSIPYQLVLGFTILSEWLYWAFTFGTVAPSFRQGEIEYLGLGTDWSIEKAKERLGYEPVKDQDEVLREVVTFEAKRLGIK